MAAKRRTSKRPNILHLFTDQQRFDTIRALGNPVIKTPNLDRLCERGVAFTNAFSPSPVCISARCSMIYGQYPHRTGCYGNERMPTDERRTFMAALTDAGYRTHGVGKCHFSPDGNALRGFQSRQRQTECGARSLDNFPYLQLLRDQGYRQVCEVHGVRGEMYYVPQVSQLPAELHPSQWIADRSMAFIREQAKGGAPWYLFSSFIHPHPPFTPPTPWHKLYRPALMPQPNVPQDVESLQTYINKMQNRYKYRDQGLDFNLIRGIKAYYYACISFVDFQVGRILQALEETAQLDHTLILFTSDHGEHLGDYHCFGKRSMHDSCARIPLIVSQPGRLGGGTRCDAPVSLVDVAPTFLAAAGASLGTHESDGVDLARVVSGAADRKTVFSQCAEVWLRPELLPGVDLKDPVTLRALMSQYMAVSREWKYVYSAPDGKELLFDRLRDPHETRNRASVEFCRQAKGEMRKTLTQFLRQGGETAGLDGDGWRAFPRCEVPADPDAWLLIQDGYTPWTDTRIPGYTDTP